MTPLHRAPWERRTLVNTLATVVCAGLTAVAAWPLLSVLGMLLYRGVPQLSLHLFTELPPAAGTLGGGIGNALVGSILVVGLAAAWSVPFGIVLGIYLAEIAPESRLATVVRFCARLLSGLPSILAGVFAFATVVWITGRFSPLAGGFALGLLMVPIITLTTEEALLRIGRDVREAAIGMGTTRAQLLWYVLLPTAWPGILTGVLLALSRAAGETAPLLFTMTFSDYWLSGNLLEPTASLAVLIYQFSKSPFANQQAIAWSAALVLVLLVLGLTLVGRAWSHRWAKTGRAA